MQLRLWILLLGSLLIANCQARSKKSALAPEPLLLHLTQLVARQTLTSDSIVQLVGPAGKYLPNGFGKQVLFTGWSDIDMVDDKVQQFKWLELTALKPAKLTSEQPGWRGRLPYTLLTLEAYLGKWEEDPPHLHKDDLDNFYSVSFHYRDSLTGRSARVQAFIDSPDRSAKAAINSIVITPSRN